MNKTEQKVLETLKNGFGLTSAEQEILANYIDKLQKENYELNSDLEVFKRALTDIEKENEELKDSREVLSKEILSDKATIVLFKGKIEELQKENEEYHRIKKELIRVNKKIYDVDTIDEFIETIDKLQKENEELKGIKNGTTIEYIGKATYWRKDKIEKYFISKDIIRDKIKEYNKQREKAETKEINDMFVNYIDVLNELLGE